MTGDISRDRGQRAALCFAASLLLILDGAPGAIAAKRDCGQPWSNGPTPVVTDCLWLLNAALLFLPCEPACLCDVDASGGALTATDALICLQSVVAGVPMTGCDCRDVPPTSTTTTTLGISACPNTAEITWHAGVGAPCTTDDDCPAGACDSGLGHCRTATELDMGWTGLGHDADWNDGQTESLRLECSATSAPCGSCEVTGIDPGRGDCRCRNDNGIRCDEPFAPDVDDCGGAACECYLGPPLPLSVGNTPFCFLNQFGADVTGTLDVDAGSSALRIALRSVVFLGEAFNLPCPYCDGDVVAGDTVRDGTCLEGPNAGQPCDVDAVNATFPAPGGGGHSLDCFPDPGKNISGTGLRIGFDQTTGSVALSAAVDCSSFGIPLTCHCGLCSENQSLACTSDADCIAESAGLCRRWANFDPRPNGCAGASSCSGAPEGDSTCDEGPIDTTCDGLIRANGEGLVSCASNADCDVSVLGIDAGKCTLSKNRECFLPTISANGTLDPRSPVTAAIACMSRLSSNGTSSVIGLPGPVRLRVEQTLRRFCGGIGGPEYQPGNGRSAAAEF